MMFYQLDTTYAYYLVFNSLFNLVDRTFHPFFIFSKIRFPRKKNLYIYSHSQSTTFLHDINNKYNL